MPGTRTESAPKLTAGARTRQSILRAAVDLASAEGLEGLSIGRLAGELGMSKSGLFAHFGSKEELQLATVEAAAEIFVKTVVRPALAEAAGLPRLRALCESWLAYAQKEVFRGGCFFAAASAEFDSRPGAVRDLVASMMKDWLATLETAVRKAREHGDLDPKSDSAQLAFELNAFGMAANQAFQLHRDRKAFSRARTAIERRLAEVAIRS